MGEMSEPLSALCVCSLEGAVLNEGLDPIDEHDEDTSESDDLKLALNGDEEDIINIFCDSCLCWTGY